MRVIAGTARSIRLAFPTGAEVRPTSDMVREALFASLGDRTIDARFADLYAGSGSVGIEALSRGAAHCLFVERDARCIQALRSNLDKTGLAARAEVVRGDCGRLLAEVWTRDRPDIVFLDPPYRDDATALVDSLLAWAARDQRYCMIVLQCERGREPALEPDKTKHYGGTSMMFWEIVPDAATDGA